VCPGFVNGVGCGRKVAKLYGAGTYFLCRHCYRLAYASQREDRYDRASRWANNIRMRLGGELGTASAFPPRPKGMHRQTYDRLQSAVSNAEILAQERLVFCSGPSSAVIAEASVGRLVGLRRSSGHERG
jgi:hypothetical protein